MLLLPPTPPRHSSALPPLRLLVHRLALKRPPSALADYLHHVCVGADEERSGARATTEPTAAPLAGRGERTEHEPRPNPRPPPTEWG
eukprot:3523498-Prymnesium_polylepis.1